MKKIVVVMLAIIMMFGMTVCVFAAPGGQPRTEISFRTEVLTGEDVDVKEESIILEVVPCSEATENEVVLSEREVTVIQPVHGWRRIDTVKEIETTTTVRAWDETTVLTTTTITKTPYTTTNRYKITKKYDKDGNLESETEELQESNTVYGEAVIEVDEDTEVIIGEASENSESVITYTTIEGIWIDWYNPGKAKKGK